MTYRDDHNRLIQWLLDFGTAPLRKITQSDLNSINRNIEAICNCAEPAGSIHMANQINMTGVVIKPLLKSGALQIHAELNEMFNALFKQDALGTAKIPGPDNILLIRHPSRRWILRRAQVSYPHLLWYNVGILFAEAGSRIQQCEECGKLFLAKTNRKAPCSLKCSRKGRNRRWYQTHSWYARKRRREAYLKEIHKLHPNAKIRRRSVKHTKTGG
jgi:hypothetical protein